jgi:hypothetical protein
MSSATRSLWDDVQADTLQEALSAPAGRRQRHTEWSNHTSFIDGGYLARIVRQHCRCCGGVAELSEGVFHVETKLGASSRRLTQLAPNAQWPVEPDRPMEVTEQEVAYCVECLRALGFTTERRAQAGFVKGH